MHLLRYIPKALLPVVKQSKACVLFYQRQGRQLLSKTAHTIFYTFCLLASRFAPTVHICPQLFLVDSGDTFQPRQRKHRAIMKQKALHVIMPFKFKISFDGFRPTVLWKIFFYQPYSLLYIGLAFLYGITRTINPLAVHRICPKRIFTRTNVNNYLFHNSVFLRRNGD